MCIGSSVARTMLITIGTLSHQISADVSAAVAVTAIRRPLGAEGAKRVNAC